MENIIIFGMGSSAERVYHEYKKKTNIIAFTANSMYDYPVNELYGIQAIIPDEIAQQKFDSIIVASGHFDEIYIQLTERHGVNKCKVKNGLPSVYNDARLNALQNVAFELERKNIKGNVAELGVYRGEFAKHINKVFSERTIHLFDTFEGFPIQDINEENKISLMSDLNYVAEGHLSDTSVDLVMSKMVFPNKVIIHKGYFPETAKNLKSSEMFAFVSIDVDLYRPVYEGLNYFYERLTTGGGVIFLHDYYGDEFPNVISAFDKFCNVQLEKGINVKYVPIGDGCSLGIVK